MTFDCQIGDICMASSSPATKLPPPAPSPQKPSQPPLSAAVVKQSPQPQPLPAAPQKPSQPPPGAAAVKQPLAVTERVHVSYQQLSLAATNLNSASNELGQVIGVLDKTLKTFNLGVAAWV